MNNINQMRLLLVLAVFLFSKQVTAQTALPGANINYTQRQPLFNNNHLNDSTTGKKWFVSKYIGMSTSIGFFNGGNATVLSVPVGLQLSRRLNNNWYAFAGLSAVPAYVNFNHSFLSANTHKIGQGNNFLSTNHFGIYSRAEMGLMYTNDQKTFSISGSIGIQQSSFPLVPYSQVGVMPNGFAAPNPKR
jgi:hypothetical protein